MRKIITTTFVTMDGVMQAPGGPEEDTSNNFKWGGWSFHYWDDMMSNTMDGFISQPFDLLLGRKTYDIFSAYWPDIKNDAIADSFNSTAKYVVSHNKLDLSWSNSKLVTGDVPAELKKLKQSSGNDLWVHGSGNLIQTLLKNQLVDRMYIWTFPITTGSGKKLLETGILPKAWKATESNLSSTGVIITSYEPAGEIVPGSFAQEKEGN
jgi:dihydrofolate reductase